MNSTTRDVVPIARRLVVFQVVTGFVLAVVFGATQGLWHAGSALFGAFISIASVLFLVRGVVRAGKTAAEHPQRSMGVLYFGAAQRFLMIIALFAIAIYAMHLDALATAAGFILAQLGFFLNFKQLSKAK